MCNKIVDLTKRIKDKKAELETLEVPEMDEDLIMAMDFAEDLSIITFNTIMTILEDEGILPIGAYTRKEGEPDED